MELISSWIESAAGAIGLQSWALTVFVVVLLALLLDFVQRRIMKRAGAWVAKSPTQWDNALFESMAHPLTLIIWLIGITLAADVIPMKGDGHLLESGLVRIVRQTGILFAIAWFLVSFVKRAELNIIQQADKEGREIDKTTIHALGRVLQIAVVVTAILIALDNLGFSISGLLAAGGIGGLAIGLAAKDMLANFFGGVTVFMDRPFSVGDWIVLSDQGIEGVVEDIGWRQTTIRKFDKRPIYVPNAIFTTASVENPSRMSNRRINETIGLRYEDIDRMDLITAEVRKMLSEHEEIDEKQTLMVNFNAFSESSVDFFIYCMTHTIEWQWYHQVKQDVLLKISEIVHRNGAEIAFPTQTVKMDITPQLAGLDSNASKPAREDHE
jgi:MscS family membrane protein